MYNWKNALLDCSQTIREALSIIDQEALRLGIVTEGVKLLGVVTDGDIRRALLKGKTLEDSIVDIMNTNPLTASYLSPKQELSSLMEQKGLTAIPLVDEEGNIVDLHTLRNNIQIDEKENPIFIMAGGFGTRLRPLTDNCPKPMLDVGGRPMLETLILQFKKFGFRNFYISTHYLPHKIHDYFGDGQKHGVNINYVHEEEPLGTGGALGLLPPDISRQPLIMVNGDVLTSVDFLKVLQFHISSSADATMCVREHEYQIPYGVIEGEGIKVEKMTEKPTYRFHVNAGIYIINNEIISSVERNQKIDMPSLLEQQIGAGKKAHKFPIHEYWLDIGRMDDFERAQTDIQVLGLLS